MPRKISNAPPPIEPLAPSHAAPEQEPKSPKVAEPKQPTESYHRFMRAIHRRDRRVAEFYADKCRSEGLSEALLAELNLLNDGSSSKGRRGPASVIVADLVKAMKNDIRRGRLTVDELRDYKKEAFSCKL